MCSGSSIEESRVYATRSENMMVRGGRSPSGSPRELRASASLQATVDPQPRQNRALASFPNPHAWHATTNAAAQDAQNLRASLFSVEQVVQRTCGTVSEASGPPTLLKHSTRGLVPPPAGAAFSGGLRFRRPYGRRRG